MIFNTLNISNDPNKTLSSFRSTLYDHYIPKKMKKDLTVDLYEYGSSISNRIKNNKDFKNMKYIALKKIKNNINSRQTEYKNNDIKPNFISLRKNLISSNIKRSSNTSIENIINNISTQYNTNQKNMTSGEKQANTLNNTTYNWPKKNCIYKNLFKKNIKKLNYIKNESTETSSFFQTNHLSKDNESNKKKYNKTLAKRNLNNLLLKIRKKNGMDNIWNNRILSENKNNKTKNDNSKNSIYYILKQNKPNKSSLYYSEEEYNVNKFSDEGLDDSHIELTKDKKLNFYETHLENTAETKISLSSYKKNKKKYKLCEGYIELENLVSNKENNISYKTYLDINKDGKYFYCFDKIRRGSMDEIEKRYHKINKKINIGISNLINNYQKKIKNNQTAINDFKKINNKSMREFSINTQSFKTLYYILLKRKKKLQT